MSGFGFIFFCFFPFMSQFRHLFFVVILLKCSSIFSRFPEEKSFVVYSLFLGCLSCLTLDVGVFLSRFNFYFLRSASPSWTSSCTCSTWCSSSSMAVTSPGPQRSCWSGRFFAQMLLFYCFYIFPSGIVLSSRAKNCF